MPKARPDRQNPLPALDEMSAATIGSQFVDRIRAAVRCAANAVHMAPPAERYRNRKILATGEPSTNDGGGLFQQPALPNDLSLRPEPGPQAAPNTDMWIPVRLCARPHGPLVFNLDCRGASD